MSRAINTDVYFNRTPVKILEEKIEIYNKYPSVENYIIMSKSFTDWLRLDGNLIVPVMSFSACNTRYNIKDKIENGYDDVEYAEYFKAVAVPSEEGDLWLVGYTNPDEAEKVPVADRFIMTSLEFLYGCLLWPEHIHPEGIIINPWGHYMILTMDILQDIFN